MVHLLLVSGADPNIQDTVSGVRVGNGTVEWLVNTYSSTSSRFAAVWYYVYAFIRYTFTQIGSIPAVQKRALDLSLPGLVTSCWHNCSIIRPGFINDHPSAIISYQHLLLKLKGYFHSSNIACEVCAILL